MYETSAKKIDKKIPVTINLKPIDQPENFRTLENSNFRSIEV